VVRSGNRPEGEGEYGDGMAHGGVSGTDLLWMRCVRTVYTIVLLGTGMHRKEGSPVSTDGMYRSTIGDIRSCLCPVPHASGGQQTPPLKTHNQSIDLLLVSYLHIEISRPHIATTARRIPLVWTAQVRT
jgi:hypothetical protein